jgi:hypothetical protein
MAGRVERRLRPAATPGYWRRHVRKESVRNTGSPKAWSAITNGARCVSSARRDLCGGRGEILVPTATIGATAAADMNDLPTRGVIFPRRARIFAKGIASPAGSFHGFDKRVSFQNPIHHAGEAWRIGVAKECDEHGLPASHHGSMRRSGSCRRSLEPDIGKVQEASRILHVDVFAPFNGAAGFALADKLGTSASRRYDGQTFLEPIRKPDPRVCG